MNDKNKYMFGKTNINDLTSSKVQNSTFLNKVINYNTNYEPNINKYYTASSNNLNVFSSVFNVIREIDNSDLQNKLLLFISEFMMILNQVRGSSNVFPSFILKNDDDSLFLEWVFKDFRVGFTFCEDDNESMWFLVSNRNLEELSVSGDLNPSNYREIIIKILDFAFRNT